MYIHLEIRLIYFGGAEKPGVLCYNISIVNDLTQMLNFHTQIPDCYSHKPALLDFFLSFNIRIFSVVALPALGYSDVVVSVFHCFSESKEDVLFHYTVYGYSSAGCDGLHDDLRNDQWDAGA